MTRILVIEDDADLAFGLIRNLELEGYRVEAAADGREGLDRAVSWRPDLIILDVMLPGPDGFDVLDRLRRNGYRHPILMLTARSEEVDKVRALRGGADDYLTKPFGLLELIARVEVLLRRAAPAARAQTCRFGGVDIDTGARVVRRDGGEVGLTPKEYDLLLALVERGGAVVSRSELMRDVWGHRSAVMSRTVDTHIGELRRKLETDPARPRHILTVHGVGYRLVP